MSLVAVAAWIVAHVSRESSGDEHAKGDQKPPEMKESQFVAHFIERNNERGVVKEPPAALNDSRKWKHSPVDLPIAHINPLAMFETHPLEVGDFSHAKLLMQGLTSGVGQGDTAYHDSNRQTPQFIK